MRSLLQLLPLAACLSLLACAPPDPTATRAESSSTGATSDAPEDEAQNGGAPIGKYDVGRMQGEISCLQTHFTTKPEELKLMTERLLRQNGQTQDSFDALVVEVDAEGKKWRKRLAETAKSRKDELCPKGTLSDESMATLKLVGEEQPYSPAGDDTAAEGGTEEAPAPEAPAEADEGEGAPPAEDGGGESSGEEAPAADEASSESPEAEKN